MHSQVLRRLGIPQAASLCSLQAESSGSCPTPGAPWCRKCPGSAWMLCKHTTQDSPRNFILPVDKKLSQLISRKTAESSNPWQTKKINSSEPVYSPRRKPAPSHQTTSVLLIIPISVQGLTAAPHTDFVSVFRAWPSPECTQSCMQTVQSCVFVTWISNCIYFIINNHKWFISPGSAPDHKAHASSAGMCRAYFSSVTCLLGSFTCVLPSFQDRLEA